MKAAPDAESLVARLVPESRLRRWLGELVPGDGPFELERITAGHSNEMFLVRRSGYQWVLRRPPRTSAASSAHDMVREFRVLTALESSMVPRPRPLALCEDPEVIGAPFYLMERVEGGVLSPPLRPPFDGPEVARVLAESLIDVLAGIHSLDWRACGLEGFGRPEGYTARQVDRWTGQLDRYRFRPLPDLDEAAARLRASVPPSQRSTLIHGDFGLHNMMYAPAPPPEAVAVVDWETATIGDPLADLGYLLGFWNDPDERGTWRLRHLSLEPGAPTRAELAARYEARSGIGVEALDWYRALGQLKLAVILEGSYAKHVRGGADDQAYASFETFVPYLAARALAITSGEA